MDFGLRVARSRPDRVPSARQQAAQRALDICKDADAVATQAAAALGVDDDRLFALLEQREEMLADLAEHLVVLRAERPTADNPLLAASERVVDDADALVAEVCDALSASQRATLALAVRVAERAGELRAELAQVQRAGVAGIGYGVPDIGRQVDRLR